MVGDRRESRGQLLGAFLVCRAGFAGRDMQVARTTERPNNFRAEL